MTARSALRRRRTQIAALLVVVLVASGAVLAVIGATSVANSTAGQIVAADARPVVLLPNTDNAAIAVVDESGQLASLAIATLLPGGRGGSIVTVPISADVNIGLGPDVRPLSSVLDIDDPDSFFVTVENMVGVSLHFGEIVGAARLAQLVEPVAPVDVVLPAPVVGSSGVVADAGTQRLDATDAAAALAAAPDTGRSYDHHVLDVAVWSALAEAGAEDLDVEAVASPDSIDALFAQLWAGRVQVRDLRVQPGVLAPDVDAVVLSRRDAVVVFSQISPTRVSAPADGMILRVVVPFSDEQVDASAAFENRSEIARTVVGELLFFQVNVISVEVTAAPGGAPAVTRIEAADPLAVDGLQASAFVTYGEAETVAATELIDGIDAVVTLGESYFDFKTDRDEVLDGAEPLTADGDLADTVLGDG